jgi:predicted DNA binding protein
MGMHKTILLEHIHKAEKRGMHKTTLLEHIHKAEKRLIGHILAQGA